MNKNINKLIIIITSILYVSCIDVIDVDLQTADSKLVIEASIDWEKGTSGNEQTIKLSISEPYFDNTSSNNVTGASVKVTNDNSGTDFIFTDQNNGKYITENFIPKLNQSYTLEVIYDGEIHIAKETLMPVVDISKITQSTEKGSNKNAIDVSVSFIDPADEENYYLMKFQEQEDLLPTLYATSDEFTNGNEMTITYEKIDDEETNEEELKPGDILNIDLYGISKNYYNYIQILINQNEGNGLFNSTPVALKGNCTNPSNPDNYAHGYFRLTQVDRKVYTIE